MSKPAFSKCKTISTDEDYESDDSEIERLRTKQIDPSNDKDVLNDFHNNAKICFTYGSSLKDIEEIKWQDFSTIFVSETEDEGALAAILLSDHGSGSDDNVTDFLEITTGYELSPHSAQYLHTMLSTPYKEALSFEPLIKEIFATKLDLKILYFTTPSTEELPWFLKQCAKKVDYFSEENSTAVYYIDNRDFLPRINMERSNHNDVDALEAMVDKVFPDYPVNISKVLKGYMDSQDEIYTVFGQYHDILGLVVVNLDVDVEQGNNDFTLSQFNHFLAPRMTNERRLSDVRTNCFQIKASYMDWPGNAVQLLEELFDLFPDRDYCVMTLPRECEPTWNIIQLFSRVSQKPSSNPDYELFVCHKASLQAGVKVTMVKPSHMSGLTSLVRGEPMREVIMRDIGHSLDTEGSDAVTVVATSCDQVIGVCVLRQEYEADYVMGNYNANIGETPARLHHMIVAPVFQRFARHFLSQILKITNNSSLVYPIFNMNAKDSGRYSIISVLDEFSLATPKDKVVTKQSDSPIKMMPPFTMFYITLADSLLPIKIHGKKVVVIGSSPMAQSILEKLCTQRLVSLPNLYHITEDQEQEYSPDVVNAAPTHLGHLDMARKKRMSLFSIVNTVLGTPTRIDRDNKKVFINDKYSCSYDKLVFCLESASHAFDNNFVCRKGILRMHNYFSIESLSSAKKCLDWFLTANERGLKDGYIIILGHNLHSLSIINSLLETGAHGRSILMVNTDSDGDVGDEIFKDQNIKEKIYQQLKVLGIRVKSYNLVDIKKDSKLSLINTVIFAKGDEFIEASCVMIINCSKSTVNRNTLNILESADLVLLEDKLIVNDRYQTNDPDILAAGTGTRHGKMSSNQGPQMDPVKCLGKILTKTEEDEFHFDEDEPNKELLKQGFNVHRERRLPGGYTYLLLDANDSSLSDNHVIHTSSENGEFKLYYNSWDKIVKIHCLYHGYFPTRNLAKLARLHVSIFPGIKEANDLFEFFQQPKWTAVFHEGFQDLRQKLRTALLHRQDSATLIGAIVLNPERDEDERMSKLRETWEEKKFSDEIENKLKSFLEQHKQELNCYNI